MSNVQKAKQWLARRAGGDDAARLSEKLAATSKQLAAVRLEREALAKKSEKKILSARRERDALAETLARFEPMRKVVHEDHLILDDVLATMDIAELALLVGHSTSLSEEVLVCGNDALVDRVTEVLRAARHTVTRVREDDRDPARDGLDLVYVARAFEPTTYEAVSSLRTQRKGRVLTLLEVFGAACLFRAIDALVGYHVGPNLKLLEYMTGETILPPLARLNDRFPLAGKRVIEFGPLDGAMTGNLVALGAREVVCVEVRLMNVIKMLAARQWLRWDHVQVVNDDMHTVDAARHGRFDLVVAHGVYYHSIAPFQFLRNLVTLGDAIYLGRFCANPARLVRPLVELPFEGHVYRAQPFDDPLQSDGAGIHPIGYYFIPEDVVAFFEREGMSVEVIDLEESPAHKAGGTYLRLLARARQAKVATTPDVAPAHVS